MRKREAFTLIEILMVIIVIGILAGAFMFSSTEVIATAKATEIINNLNVVKKAVMSFYADNPDIFEDGSLRTGIQNYLGTDKKKIALISKYFGNTNIVFQDTYKNQYTDAAGNKKYGNNVLAFQSEGSYGVADAGHEEFNGNNPKKIAGVETRYTWFVGYRFKASESRVKEKLMGRAKSLGLIFAGRIPNIEPSASEDVGGRANYTRVNDVVWLRVFGEWDKETEHYK